MKKIFSTSTHRYNLLVPTNELVEVVVVRNIAPKSYVAKDAMKAADIYCISDFTSLSDFYNLAGISEDKFDELCNTDVKLRTYIDTMYNSGLIKEGVRLFKHSKRHAVRYHTKKTTTRIYLKVYNEKLFQYLYRVVAGLIDIRTYNGKSYYNIPMSNARDMELVIDRLLNPENCIIEYGRHKRGSEITIAFANKIEEALHNRAGFLSFKNHTPEILERIESENVKKSYVGIYCTFPDLVIPKKTMYYFGAIPTTPEVDEYVSYIKSLLVSNGIKTKPVVVSVFSREYQSIGAVKIRIDKDIKHVVTILCELMGATIVKIYGSLSVYEDELNPLL